MLLSNTASHPCHSLPLRRDEQSHSRVRTVAFQLGFTSDRKSSAPGLSGAFLIGTRHLLLYFPSGLSAHSHASATAGPYRFDHSCIGRGSHAASLDRRRRSCGCFYDSSSAGNEAPPSAEG